MIKNIRKYLLLLHRFSWRNPKATLIIVAFLFTASLFGLGQLQFLLSIDDLIDPDFKTFDTLRKVNAEFKDKNTVLLSIESKDAFSKQFLCDFQVWILNTAQKRSDLAQIQTTFGIRKAKFTRDQFKIESFLNLDCLSSDPEKEKIEAGFKEIQSSPWLGILSSMRGYSITANFIVFDPEDKKFGSIDVNVVPELQKSFQDELFSKYSSENKYSFFWGGVTTYQSYLRKAFDQTQLLNLLMFVITLLIFRIFLGSWKAGFVFNITILVSMSITYG